MEREEQQQPQHTNCIESSLLFKEHPNGYQTYRV